jgi:hypothetical protein
MRLVRGVVSVSQDRIEVRSGLKGLFDMRVLRCILFYGKNSFSILNCDIGSKHSTPQYGHSNKAEAGAGVTSGGRYFRRA